MFLQPPSAYKACTICCLQSAETQQLAFFASVTHANKPHGDDLSHDEQGTADSKRNSAATHLRFFADSSNACCNAVPPCCWRSADLLGAGRSAAWGGVSGCKTSAEGDGKAESFALCGHFGGSTISTPASTSGVTCIAMRFMVTARSDICRHACTMKDEASSLSTWARCTAWPGAANCSTIAPAAHQQQPLDL